ncbi:MAG: PIN domain-containing protein [Acidimicrobiales bacterium]
MFVEITRLLIVFAATAAGLSAGSSLRGLGHAGPLLGASLGACTGYVGGGVAGRTLRSALSRADKRLERLPAAKLLAGTLAAVAGGWLGALLGAPVMLAAPSIPTWSLLALLVWVGAYSGFVLGAKRADQLLGLAGLSTRPLVRASPYARQLYADASLVDTSAVMDGRLLALAKAGLLQGAMLLAPFVLDELQAIADSDQLERRRRGRRGLEVLDALKQLPGVEVHVLDDEVVEHEAVDAKLVALARRLGAGLVTVDWPLQKIAELQGVRCVNLDSLSKALRREHSSGELFPLTIAKPGREPDQGVGYLDDGTMVVVGGAASMVGEVIEVKVTGNVSTAAGRMLFASIQ